jgi:2,6-dihydroxypseudooxynicotine hydrolase
MPDPVVGSFAAFNLLRMVADGVEYGDAVDVIASIRSMEEWCPRWMELATKYESMAENALNHSNLVSAGELFWKASLYNHYAQFMEWFNRPLKDLAVRRKAKQYSKGAPFFVPKGNLVKIPYEGTFLPGVLRLPIENINSQQSKKRPPCAILIGGLESTKEEFHTFENICLKRGLATFAFDGPGQGEVYYKIKARPNFEMATSTVIDYLERHFHESIDINSIGVVGRSLGGHYAARSAAFDKRIKGCVVWGLIYDFREWDRISPGHKDGWTYVAGKKDWNEAKEYYANFTLSGVADKITCPLYILQGRRDNIFPIEHVERLAKEASGPTTLVIEDLGSHCAHNMAHIVRPRMADWLSATLLRKS